MNSNLRFVIGIDPGAQTGIAMVNPARPGEVYPMTIPWGVDGAGVFARLRELQSVATGASVKVVIEIPGKAHFPRNVSQRANYRIAGNVGECRAKAAAIGGYCRALGWEVIERQPIKGLTKLSAALWRAYFPKYSGRPPSNHACDAAMLARWGAAGLKAKP